MAGKTKDTKLLYAVLLGVVAVAGILVLGLGKSAELSGAVTFDRELLADGYYPGCTDDDPLNYYDLKGSVKSKKYLYHDYCGGDKFGDKFGNKLFQVYCASSKKVAMTRGYECPKGCEAGACLS